jgi:hypothetical protein
MGNMTTSATAAQRILNFKKALVAVYFNRFSWTAG